MRVVHRTDPVVRATQLKQLLVNPVDKFLALVGHHNFRLSVSGNQLVQESVTLRGPINIYPSEQVKFKPSLNLTQASMKKAINIQQLCYILRKKK